MKDFWSKKIIITIRCVSPSSASQADLRAHLIDAIESWCGQLRPPGAYNEEDSGDPMSAGVVIKSIKIQKDSK